MHDYQPYSVIGFHSCDREVGLRVLNGVDVLKQSNNPWDWLGTGIYFWEQNPARALEYAEENASGKQRNKTRIKTPFVLGAIVELGNCLNLVEAGSLQLLQKAYDGLERITHEAGGTMPENHPTNPAIRTLDCAVIQYLHATYDEAGEPPYDTVRCAFPEGKEAFPGATITDRLHIQIAVLNPECIKGYFLPQPIARYNPHLRADDFNSW